MKGAGPDLTRRRGRLAQFTAQQDGAFRPSSQAEYERAFGHREFSTDAMRPETKRLARQLRSEYALPMKEIAARVGASQSSVSLWTRDIVLTPAQHARNLDLAKKRRGKAWAAINRRRRLEYQEEGRRRARQADRLHQAGCMLYWAEGAKNRNVVCFANSDVDMVRFFSRFLIESLEVSIEDFTLRLNVYTGNGLSIEEIENQWLTALSLPRSCLRGHVVNHTPTSSSGRKKGRLPHGVCQIRIRSTRLVQHIYGAIQEYGGFEMPEWVDGPKRPVRKSRALPDDLGQQQLE